MSDSPPSGNKRAAASPPVAEPEADTPDAKKTKQGSEPVALGYKTFKNGREATVYFHKLVQDWPANVDLNPYELNVVESLLTSGHPDSAKKVGDGLRAIQVRVNHAFDPPSRCFFVVRKDGTMEDFSYRKCLAGVRAL
ncbi:unnamed protein product [Pedinophyceae sp. YPF-701]|nr:unnamed protein product [Pedinophyceae sp. YPF-701]